MFKSISQDKRLGMRPTGVNIKAANGTSVMCYGVCSIRVKIEHFEMENDFFIIEDSVIPIIGRDFMRRHDVHHRTAKDKIYVGETEIPGYTMKGAKVKGSVSVNRLYVIQPGKEVVSDDNQCGKNDGFGGCGQ